MSVKGHTKFLFTLRLLYNVLIASFQVLNKSKEMVEKCTEPVFDIPEVALEPKDFSQIDYDDLEDFKLSKKNKTFNIFGKPVNLEDIDITIECQVPQ